MKPFSPSLPVFLVASLAVLGGCASHAPRNDSIGAEPADISRTWAEQIGKAGVGELVDLPEGNELGEPSVRVGAPYTAASGRECRRLASADHQVLARLVCYGTDQKRWYLTRSLSVLLKNQREREEEALTTAPETARQTLVLASSRKEEPVETREITDGETLWSFASRHTGDPTNWQAIARYNRISDTAAIQAGTVLVIPVSMMQGRD